MFRRLRSERSELPGQTQKRVSPKSLFPPSRGAAWCAPTLKSWGSSLFVERFCGIYMNCSTRLRRLRLVPQDNQELADFTALLLDGGGFSFVGLLVKLQLLL